MMHKGIALRFHIAMPKRSRQLPRSNITFKRSLQIANDFLTIPDTNLHEMLCSSEIRLRSGPCMYRGSSLWVGH